MVTNISLCQIAINLFLWIAPCAFCTMDRPVSIQVGGKTFASRLSTIAKFPEALLWKAYGFNSKHFDLVFWDRNPRVFECLLDYYRTNRLALPPDVDLQTIKTELSFWGFEIQPPERPPWPVLPSASPPLRAQEIPAIPYPLGPALRLVQRRGQRPADARSDETAQDRSAGGGGDGSHDGSLLTI